MTGLAAWIERRVLESTRCFRHDIVTDEPLGPAFDTVTLIRPTPRKLACLWVEQAGLRTPLLPTVWDQLTYKRKSASAVNVNVASWERIASYKDAPFRWVELDDGQKDAVDDLLQHFTQPCFPRLTADQIPDDPDANIIAEALVTGTDVLVTQDVNTIDHDEINHVIERRLGANAGFVLTLDKALGQAFRGGEAANHLLTLALATIAPSQSQEWNVGAAYEDLMRLCKALAGANVRDTATRLVTRWEQCPDLDCALMNAQFMAEHSQSLRFERMRAEWQREAAQNQRSSRNERDQISRPPATKWRRTGR